MTPTGWTVLAAALLFISFLVLKSRVSLRTATPERAASQRKLSLVRKKARDSSLSLQERAEAWREAATIALHELGRPQLAASFALRAEREQPGDARSLEAVAAVLRRAQKFRALENLLWDRLSSDRQQDTWDSAFEELVSLYEGPMRRPERAAVLKALKAGSTTRTSL